MQSVSVREMVDAVFTKCSLVYGRDFLSRWEGLDLAEVKEDWAHELSGFAGAPHAIRYAIQNLPVTKPPNVFEFRQIALRAPPLPAPRLEAPRANPVLVNEELARAFAAVRRRAASEA